MVRARVVLSSLQIQINFTLTVPTTANANPLDARYHSKLMSFASSRDAISRYICPGHLRHPTLRIETLITSNFPIRSRHVCAKLNRASFPPSNGRSQSLPSYLFVANGREKASSPTPIAFFTLTVRRGRLTQGDRSQIRRSIRAISRWRGWRTWI